MTEHNDNIPTTVDNPFGTAPIAAAPTGAAAAAVVQREVAEVQAAMVIAKKFPRDPIVAMDRILQACTRPGLANTALYQYSRGGQDISGASIRLAEELARDWGNIVCGVTELTRHGGVSECMAYAWDLETNFRDEKRFQVKHWRDTKSGGYALKDERDIYELIANQGSRRKRACILAVIPGDVQERAVEQCEVTLRAKVEVTQERIKSMIEKFEEYGITQQMVEKRIQRRIDAMTPALMLNLGRIYNSLRDGMSTPADWFDVQPAAEPEQAPAKGVEGAKAALRRASHAKGDKPKATPEPELDPDEAAARADAQRQMPV